MGSTRFNIAMMIFTLVGLPAFARAADDVAYDLRGAAPEKGQIYVLTAKSTSREVVRKFGGQSVGGQRVEVHNKKNEIELLEVSGGEITKMRTKVIQDQNEETSKQKQRRRDSKTTTNREMHGQILYSQLTNNKWTTFLEDAKPNEKQRRLLKEYSPFKEDDLLLTTEKVSVGGSWKIEQPTLVKVFGSQFENVRGTGTGKLLRIEKEDNDEIAVIEFAFEFTGKSIDEEGTLDAKVSAKATSFRSLKYGFDRKSTSVTTIDMKGQITIEDEKGEYEFHGVFDGLDVVELKKKD